MKKIKQFLASFQLKKLLDNKRFTIPLSIFLSIVLWLVIVTSQNPIIERSFTGMSVNVNLENTFASENGMSMISDISTQKFTVVVRGATYEVSSLKSSDISVFASAASVDAPGEYNLDVVASKSNTMSGIEILSITPATVKVSFDYIDTKEFTIKPRAEGVTAEEGLIVEAGVVSGTESDTLTVSGPREILNKIDSVVARALVNKTLSVSETFDADIVLYDQNGEEIITDNLNLSTKKVKVTVPISKTKTVPVVADFSNLPENFDKSSIPYTLNYSEVSIIGKPEMIDKTESITLSPIDIRNVSLSSTSFDVSAKLTDGIRLVDNIEYFTVGISLQNYEEKTINVSEINYVGLSKNFKVSGAGEIKNVKICGPKSSVRNISASNVYAEIDLTDKTAGQHSVEVVIKFKDDNKVWAIGTYTTNVTIK